MIISNYYTEEQRKEISKRYKVLLKDTYIPLSDKDKKEIRKALDVALDAHRDQRRKTGEPYVYHPLEVAYIVGHEIGLGKVAIVCALLHDVVEDSDNYDLEDIKRLFDERTARIIDGLTKIAIIKNQDVSVQTENYRKLIFTLSEDVRVIMIKLADRLHNMRTMYAMPKAKQYKIASETLFIYSPLAHRLGLYNIKTELEDLSLRYTEPEAYLEIERKLLETQTERTTYIKNFVDVIDTALKRQNTNDYLIKGRPKSIFSIHKKISGQGIDFDEVFDKFAIRIVYKSPPEQEKFTAWKIYSIVTDIFKPNPNRLRDWISQPKSTGYESLHITVMGPQGRWVEVQIRSERMNELAEKGIAAHYKYKHNTSEETELDLWIIKIREALESTDATDYANLIDNLKLNLYAKEIYVFTPKGDLVKLPKGATSLDFAYAIHSKVGDHCLGSKVNSKLVPLSYELNSGDQIEIISSPTQRPKTDWLDFVITSKAKSRIRAALNQQKKNIVASGKETLERKLKHMKVSFNDETMTAMVNYFKTQTSQEIYYRVATGALSTSDIRQFASDTTGGLLKNMFKRLRRSPAGRFFQEIREEPPSKLDLLVFGLDEEKLPYTLASCCSPIAGDAVFGFITVNQGIRIHKMSCPNAIALRANYAYRVLEAKWIDASKQLFKAFLIIKGIDYAGILNEITQTISSFPMVNLKRVDFSASEGFFEGSMDLVVNNKKQLEEIITKFRKIEGITAVNRR